MHRRVFLAQDSSQTAVPLIIGRLDCTDVGYRFAYCAGIKHASDFIAFPGMSKLDAAYEKADLFPLFANRVLSCRRPEYPDFVRWLGLESESANPMDILAHSEGRRATDGYFTFADIPANAQGVYGACFLAHDVAQNLSDFNLKVGTCLHALPTQDFQTVALTTDSGTTVGRLPDYLSFILAQALQSDVDNLCLRVKRVNTDAPKIYRLLCEFEYRPSSPNTKLFSEDCFRTLA